MKIERLRLVKVKEEARARQQLSGAAHLHDAALVDHENPVCVQDCGQAVGHGDGCPSRPNFGDGRTYLLVGQGIEGSGCFVQQEEPGALQQGPSNGKTLAFAAGERQGLLPHDRMVAVRQARDELIDLCLTGSLPAPVRLVIAARIGDIPAYAVVPQERTLGNKANLISQG